MNNRVAWRLGATVIALLAVAACAQQQADLDTKASQVSVKTSTASGASHGITYRITADANLRPASAAHALKPQPDSSSLVVLDVDCPRVSKKPFVLQFELDEEKPGAGSPGLNTSGSTSFGLRGRGEMPTAIHPRYELTFKDEQGEYGSALLVKSAQPLAFVSQKLVTEGAKPRTVVVVASDLAPAKNAAPGGGSFDEIVFQASSIAVWPYEREFLAATAKDPKTSRALTEAAKALLERFK